MNNQDEIEIPESQILFRQTLMETRLSPEHVYEKKSNSVIPKIMITTEDYPAAKPKLVPVMDYLTKLKNKIKVEKKMDKDNGVKDNPVINQKEDQFKDKLRNRLLLKNCDSPIPPPRSSSLIGKASVLNKKGLTEEVIEELNDDFDSILSSIDNLLITEMETIEETLDITTNNEIKNVGNKIISSKENDIIGKPFYSSKLMYNKSALPEQPIYHTNATVNEVNNFSPEKENVYDITPTTNLASEDLSGYQKKTKMTNGITDEENCSRMKNKEIKAVGIMITKEGTMEDEPNYSTNTMANEENLYDILPKKNLVSKDLSGYQKKTGMTKGIYRTDGITDEENCSIIKNIKIKSVGNMVTKEEQNYTINTMANEVNNVCLEEENVYDITPKENFVREYLPGFQRKTKEVQIDHSDVQIAKEGSVKKKTNNFAENVKNIGKMTNICFKEDDVLNLSFISSKKVPSKPIPVLELNKNTRNNQIGYDDILNVKDAATNVIFSSDDVNEKNIENKTDSNMFTKEGTLKEDQNITANEVNNVSPKEENLYDIPRKLPKMVTPKKKSVAEELTGFNMHIKKDQNEEGIVKKEMNNYSTSEENIGKIKNICHLVDKPLIPPKPLLTKLRVPRDVSGSKKKIKEVNLNHNYVKMSKEGTIGEIYNKRPHTSTNEENNGKINDLSSKEYNTVDKLVSLKIDLPKEYPRLRVIPKDVNNAIDEEYSLCTKVNAIDKDNSGEKKIVGKKTAILSKENNLVKPFSIKSKMVPLLLKDVKQLDRKPKEIQMVDKSIPKKIKIEDKFRDKLNIMINNPKFEIQVDRINNEDEKERILSPVVIKKQDKFTNELCDKFEVLAKKNILMRKKEALIGNCTIDENIEESNLSTKPVSLNTKMASPKILEDSKNLHNVDVENNTNNNENKITDKYNMLTDKSKLDIQSNKKMETQVNITDGRAKKASSLM